MKDVIEFGLRGWMYASLSGTIGLLLWSARESLTSAKERVDTAYPVAKLRQEQGERR